MVGKKFVEIFPWPPKVMLSWFSSDSYTFRDLHFLKVRGRKCASGSYYG
jgi:hypothetical protein